MNCEDAGNVFYPFGIVCARWMSVRQAYNLLFPELRKNLVGCIYFLRPDHRSAPLPPGIEDQHTVTAELPAYTRSRRIDCAGKSIAFLLPAEKGAGFFFGA